MNKAYQIRENGPKPLISVIVPVYKVEKYLGRCIDSITGQTWQNLEIILVDDGSPDNCGAICDEYSRKDQRIRVIHKTNGGLSDARNHGLGIAKGDYIGFVDSDDFIHREMFSELMRLMMNNNADITQCSFLKVTGDQAVDPGNNPDFRILTSMEALQLFYTPYVVDYVVAWNKLYRKELFAETRFPVSKIHEDEFTTYRLFYSASKIVVTGARYYYYYQSPNSIIRSSFNEKKLHYAEAMEERIAFFREKGLGSLQMKALKSYALWLLFFYFQNHGPLRKKPELGQKVLSKIRKTSEETTGHKNYPLRFRWVMQISRNLPLPVGFLVYHQMYKRNIFSLIAEMLDLK